MPHQYRIFNDVTPLLLEEIYEVQLQDQQLLEAREVAQSGSPSDYTVRRDCLLLFKDCICVPAVESLKELILQKAHGLAYAMHLGSTKMYCNLRETYWWKGMNQDIVGFVARCCTCQ